MLLNYSCKKCKTIDFNISSKIKDKILCPICGKTLKIRRLIADEMNVPKYVINEHFYNQFIVLYVIFLTVMLFTENHLIATVSFVMFIITILITETLTRK